MSCPPLLTAPCWSLRDSVRPLIAYPPPFTPPLPPVLDVRWRLRTSVLYPHTPAWPSTGVVVVVGGAPQPRRSGVACAGRVRGGCRTDGSLAVWPGRAVWLQNETGSSRWPAGEEVKFVNCTSNIFNPAPVRYFVLHQYCMCPPVPVCTCTRTSQQNT